MKLLKLSLATMLAMGTASFAADTLADAFKDGTFKGQLKAYYFDRDNADSTIKGSIINFGVKADYETAAFHGFKAGFGFQSSSAPWADDDGKNAYKGDMWGSGAVLSQAYLSYNISKTTVKVGRQYIRMPFIVSSPSRLLLQSFEGVTIVSKEIPATTIMGAYVNKYQHWTDGSGNAPKFKDLGTDMDYAYVIAVQNKSLPNTTLKVAYGELDNSHAIFYADAKYAGKTDSFTYDAAVQYSDTDYDAAATEDASYYGVKLGMGIGGLKAYAAYAEVEDGTAQYRVSGTGSKPTIFTTAIISAGEYAESEQYAFNVTYNFKELGLGFDARYVNVDFAGNDEADWMIFRTRYKFSGALKGLSMSAVYEDEDHDTNSKDDKNLWFKTVYSF